MMYQWTDGEVSHVVKLALESVRSAVPSLATSQRGRLVETVAGELAASAWHAHAIDIDAIEPDRRRPWATIASDLEHDWSEFCPFAFYAPSLMQMFQTVRESGAVAEEVVRRSCKLSQTSEQQASEQGGSEHYALAWLAVQPEGTCACVEFLKRAGDGPFTQRDEALVRILSTELLAEPAAANDRLEMAELADLPRRQREVLTGLLAGSSVKEIANDLGISPYTVNDYIKALYRRYQVSSRGELMAAMHGLRRPAVPK